MIEMHRLKNAEKMFKKVFSENKFYILFLKALQSSQEKTCARVSF